MRIWEEVSGLVAEAGDLLADRYRLERQIGSGGTSTVWRATDEVLGRTVAVKVLSAEIEEHRARERFTQEAQAAAGLRHPNIVTVFDLGEDEDRPYMVLEYVDGPSLAHVIRDRGELPVGVVVTVGCAVAKALGEAHSRGLVHRDVKPGNVLLSRSGDVKVADFGIVKALDAVDASLTQTGVVVGTATYLSPEQLDGADVGPPTDVYALGLMLHECLTGRPAFGGETTTEVALARLSQAPDPPGSIREDVPPELDDAIATATDRDPEARYEDGSAFAAVLGGIPGAVPPSEIAELADRSTPETGSVRFEYGATGARAGAGEPEEEVGGPGTREFEAAEEEQPHETDATVAIPPTRADRVGARARGGGRRERPGDGRGTRDADGRAAGVAATVRRPPIVAVGVITLVALLGVLAIVAPWGGDDDGDGEADEPIEIVAAEAFDPFGDGEHPDRAPNAHDGDAGTTWTTQRYNSPDLGGLKEGVGIWFDLGETTAVEVVEIDLLAGGADLELYALDETPTQDTDAWGEPVSQEADSPGEVRLEADGTEGRYWLVWLTSLPSDGGRYRAEIADVRFVSP